MTSQQDTDRDVFAHGKKVTIQVEPVMEALYKLRPLRDGETRKDRVKAVEDAYAVVTSWKDKEVIKELERLRVAFYDNNPTFDGDELTRRIKSLQSQGGKNE